MMESTEPNESSAAASKRSSMACTTCRQLRCDATTRFPAPCSRCEKQRRACLFDPTFKRRTMRGALEKATEENNQLQQIVQSFREAGLDGESSTRLSSAADEPTSSSAADQPDHSPVDESASLPTTIFEIGGAYLDAQTVQDLFTHFRRHFFHHLPILDIQRSITSVYSNSSILFWAVVITSVRQHPVHCSHFARLQQPFRTLLSEHLVNSIRSIYTVQALLLLCVWPLPVRQQCDDPSWTYCGLVVAAALQLHLDGYQQAFSINDSSSEQVLRLKTWLGCFVVSNSLAADLGLPPPMNSVASREATVRQRVQKHLPEDFIAQLDCQHYVARAGAVLINNVSSPLQSSLLNLLELDLNSIEDRLLPTAKLTLRIDLLSAKLRVYAAPLLSYRGCGVESSGNLNKEVWYKGFHIALQLAHIFAEPEVRDCPDDPKGDRVTIYFPKHYFRILVMATVYLITFTAIVRDIPPQDRMLARNCIKQVFGSFMAKSRADNDEAARTAMLIELLSRHAEDEASALFFQEATEDSSPAALDNALKIARKIRESTPNPKSVPDSEQWKMPGPGVEISEFQQDGAPFLDNGLIADWDTWITNASDIMDLLDPNYNNLLQQNRWP